MEKIYRVDPTELIEAVAAELKKIEHIKAPVWATFCKTGTHKARPPVRDDWWFVRAASVLRRIGIKGPIGVAKLRTLYGGKKDRGYAPEKFYCASGNILRKILQQLDRIGIAICVQSLQDRPSLKRAATMLQMPASEAQILNDASDAGDSGAIGDSARF